MIWTLLGAIGSFFGVALGAFGAHALKNSLDPQTMSIYQTAVLYQFIHSLALLIFGLWRHQFELPPWTSAIGLAFIFGIIFFSGSLYALCLTGVRALGAITPIGGILFLVAWALWAYAIIKRM